MNDQPLTAAPDRPRSKAHLLAKLHRYKNLLRKKWWVLIVGVILGLGTEAVRSRFDRPVFSSMGKMIMTPKLNIADATLYAEELSNFLGTQSELMRGEVVIGRAHARVSAQKPDLAPQPVSLSVSVSPKTTIFVLRATGDNPQYTQAFLQACMDEFISWKNDLKVGLSDTTVSRLMENVLRLEKELTRCDEELTAFQSTNKMVITAETANAAGGYLGVLQQELARKKSDYALLKDLTLDQALEHQQEKTTAAPGPEEASNPPKPTPAAASEPSAEYLKAKQDILLKRADLAELSHFLKDKHPKIIAAREEIARLERLLQIYATQSNEQLESKLASLEKQIENSQKDIEAQEAKVLQINRKTAEYQRLKDNKQRIQTEHDSLQLTIQKLDVGTGAGPDSVSILQKASPAFLSRPALSKKLATGALIGLALSLALLIVLDRLDDRLNSVTELQETFDEPILGQVPQDRAPGRRTEIKLIEPEDARHSFLEAYRNLRSSLLYMVEAGERPKTLLVTSSVPNEGKSVTSANLAITMANTGSRVLLVDADLRKGVLHSHFGLASGPGLSEALSHGMDWSEAVQATRVPNLSLLPRGAITHKSSEFFIGEVTEKFLREASAKYDYVMLDTAPVMAADDVTSLAPHLDGVLFVIRAEATSARVARAALELLYQRQVHVLGLVFNGVRPSSVDYYYYYKYKDYYKAYPTAPAGSKPEKAHSAKA